MAFFFLFCFHLGCFCFCLLPFFLPSLSLAFCTYNSSSLLPSRIPEMTSRYYALSALLLQQFFPPMKLNLEKNTTEECMCKVLAGVVPGEQLLYLRWGKSIQSRLACWHVLVVTNPGQHALPRQCLPPHLQRVLCPEYHRLARASCPVLVTGCLLTGISS